MTLWGATWQGEIPRFFPFSDERDRIRESREHANKEGLERQLRDAEKYARIQKAEDDRIFAAMSIGPSRNQRHTYPKSDADKEGGYQPSFTNKDIQAKRIPAGGVSLENPGKVQILLLMKSQ